MIWTVQLVPAAKLLPQLLLWAKSPFAVMLVIVMAALPVLLKVTGWAGLVVLTAWPAKLRLVGDQVTRGPSPVPVSVT